MISAVMWKQKAEDTEGWRCSELSPFWKQRLSGDRNQTTLVKLSQLYVHFIHYLKHLTM